MAQIARQRWVAHLDRGGHGPLKDRMEGMKTNEREPWEQLPDEPDNAYERFLVYRDLGHGRSLSKAYQAACGLEQCKRVPGNWQRHSKRLQWPERAIKWDIDRLQREGEARRHRTDPIIETLEKVNQLVHDGCSVEDLHKAIDLFKSVAQK